LTTFTKDDINDATLYLSVDFDCIMGSDSRGVYVNGDTAEEGSDVLVVVVDKNGKKVEKHGVLHYKDQSGSKKGGYVKFEGEDGGISLKDLEIDGAKAYFYIMMKTDIPSSNDVWSGATGGSGATGAGG
jgi:hypothetical protein